MNEYNHWVTLVNDPILGWDAYLPAPRGEIDAMVRFGAAVVDAGARHAVYRAILIPGARPYEPAAGPFEDYLRSQARERRRVPLFPEDPPPGTELVTPGRVAFYRDGAIVEEEVSDLGALLRELRPELVEASRMLMRGASPVTVLGASVPVDWPADVRIQIRLDTDIWLPQVMGLAEEIPEDEPKPDLYDNFELARRHTPRLNAFLAELQQTIAELGGRWVQREVEGLAVNYAHMWNESGILLPTR